MFCQKCGAENKDGAAFCNACGAALVTIPEQSTIESKPQNDQSVPKIQTKEEIQTESVSGSTPISPSKKHGIAFWAAMLIGIAVVVIVGAAILSVTTGNTPKYQAGDVITDNSTDPIGILILGYNQTADQYTCRPILQKTDGSWGYFVAQFNTTTGSRAVLEANNTLLISHIADPTTITTFDMNNPPMDVMFYKLEGYYSQTTASSSQSTSTQIGPHAAPIYQRGDIVWFLNNDPGLGMLIKNYDASSDSYTITWVDENLDETWYHDTDPNLLGDEVENRTYVESQYPYKVGSADPNNLLSYASTAPLVLTGSGDNVTEFDTPQSGTYIFTSTYSGQGNFVVWVKDSNGYTVGLAANTIDPSTGTKMLHLDTDTYYSEVTANGPWTITITPPL